MINGIAHLPAHLVPRNNLFVILRPLRSGSGSKDLYVDQKEFLSPFTQA